MAARQKRYTVSMDDSLDRDFEEAAELLGVSRAEAFRRAMMLLKHAASADQVILKDKAGKERQVLIK